MAGAAIGTSFIGTAGWSIPKQHADASPGAGSHLERYARRLPAVEINSSFYRPHRPATYARWAASVPPGFRFAVKMPRTITHERRLADVTEPLDGFLGQIEALGETLGPLLVQLPPSLSFDATRATAFFAALRNRFDGAVVCEPRHATWFSDDVDVMLSAFRVARVAADPALSPRAAKPGGWRGLAYHRLHGSPVMYSSPYAAAALAAMADSLRSACSQGQDAWCIFDNTALGHAAGNALSVSDLLR